MKTSAISRHNIAFLTCLGHLGWCDTNRNDPICVFFYNWDKIEKFPLQSNNFKDLFNCSEKIAKNLL